MNNHLAEPDREASHPEAAASTPDEAELVAQAKAHSAEAWTRIYVTYYRPMYRYVKARVFDEAAAEDLTSAVFEGALKGIGTYQYRGRPLLAWLYRIARNTVASYQRHLLGGGAKAESGAVPRWNPGRLLPWSRGQAASAGDLPSVADSEADPAAMLDRLDLRDAMRKLPDSQREVLILRFFVGLSAQEVGEALGKKPAAVYSLQARAILALRGQLA